jgi:lysophospholipase L1-like esterase
MEQQRQKLNAWIKAPGHFDGFIDFAKATQDPADPLRFKPEYDSGDHLHPSAAGYQAMADAIDLNLFN